MRKSRYTEDQMLAVLREADRTSVAEASKKHKVSEPTMYAWRKHFGQMQAADVHRLNAFELRRRTQDHCRQIMVIAFVYENNEIAERQRCG